MKCAQGKPLQGRIPAKGARAAQETTGPLYSFLDMRRKMPNEQKKSSRSTGPLLEHACLLCNFYFPHIPSGVWVQIPKWVLLGVVFADVAVLRLTAEIGQGQGLMCRRMVLCICSKQRDRQFLG